MSARKFYIIAGMLESELIAEWFKY